MGVLQDSAMISIIDLSGYFYLLRNLFFWEVGFLSFFLCRGFLSFAPQMATATALLGALALLCVPTTGAPASALITSLPGIDVSSLGFDM